MIAALFVEKNGVYSNVEGVDIWDESRDARRYKGPHPVIAHPPCQRWGAFAAANYARWGGEHNRPGNDLGCFESAKKSVEKFGGVLEHPAKTNAFKTYGILTPRGVFGWRFDKILHSGLQAWVCEVWQSAYGHRANKATWLYYVGKGRPIELRWDKPRGKHQIGRQDKRGKKKNKPTLSKKEANATPIEFMDDLIQLAKWSRR